MQNVMSQSSPRRVAPALAGSVILAAAAVAAPGSALAAASDDEAVISVIEQAMPAVVTIQAAAPTFTGREPGDLELPEGMEPRMPGGFRFPSGTGSGVIIDPDGLIITNGHVVGNADEVSVILDDGSALEGTVAGVDTLTDFAFVRVESDAELPAIELGDSSDLRIGQLAIAIGNPLGRFPGSASVGIVSGLDRAIDVFGLGTTGQRLTHLIQTDAAINPGSSGGAVLDGDGRLIGVTTAQAGMAQGIGFALPIDLAKPIIEQARAGEPIARPYIGVLYREIDAQVAESEDLPVTAGAWIVAAEEGASPVVPGSPAEEAGLQEGDIITAVDGTPVDLEQPLDLQVLRLEPGQEVTLTVRRGDETLELPAALGTRPLEPTS